MAGFHFIYDYYLKGLSPDSYRYIAGSLKELKNSLHDECILDKDTFMESMNFTEDKYSIYSEMIYWKYENINRYLLIQNRKPFFNTADLKSCISKRDELLKFLSEEECSLIYKMPSFSEYTPEVYLNNLRTVIELYTDNKYILSALQNQRPGNFNFLSGLSRHNPYKFVNWMLIYNGLKPIFLDPDNIDECNVKRKELLQLLPVEECLKYFDMENEIKKPMIFEIENLIDCYNANSRYIIGYNVARILDDETLVEDKQKCINEINKLNQTKVFENPDNLKECISFLKNKMKLVLR